MSRLREAAALGRFQPLHNEHLAYLMTALDRTDFLWIGVVGFKIADMEPVNASSPRLFSQFNPYSYFDRLLMISSALSDAAIDPCRYAITPFAFDYPGVATEFIPLGIPVLTTVVEEWDHEKIQHLTDIGYAVEVIERRQKTVSGGTVRQAIAQGIDISAVVPRATMEMVASRQRANTEVTPC